MKARGYLVAGRAVAPVPAKKARLWAWCRPLVVASGLVGCGQESEAIGTSGQATGSTCPDGSKSTYETFGARFMQQYCTRCHAASVGSSDRLGAPSDHNFDSLDGLRTTHAAHIDEQAAAGPESVNTAMPPGPPRPSTEERRELGEWLACGMP